MGPLGLGPNPGKNMKSHDGLARLLGLIAHGARVQAHEGQGIDKLSLGAPGPGTPLT